jgi:hypothetical protein
MPRPALRRSAVAAALLATATLAACTGSDTPEAGPSPAVAQSAAASTATSVVAAAEKALGDTTATGGTARQAAFSGAALRSADAWAKTLGAKSAAQRADAALSTAAVKVLGVSRAGEEPRQILAQATLKKSSAPVLVLLQASKGSDRFTVAAQTPVLAGATVDALDAATSGSASVGDGSGLALTPDAAVQAFAESVRYPDPKSASGLAADPASQQLRAAAAAQAKSISGQGTFTSEHTPKGVVGGLRLAGGKGAVVFADLQRVDSIALRNQTKLTPGKDVTLLSGLKQITTEAALTSNETVAMVIPESGQARVVAFSDQLVGATGR